MGIQVNEDNAIAETRAAMVCTRFQGRMALGETRCAVLDAMVDNLEIAWTTREALKNTLYWHRDSPTIANLASVFELDDEDLDELFTVAMAIEV